ncbi:MAG: MarR family transcriptional regulator [Chromatiales bacterium]|nr:MarR family transcriptional regulator [Chromatiales bacterium]
MTDQGSSRYASRQRAGQDLPGPEDSVLRALRRIMQAVDLYSRQLVGDHGITGPQLICLRQLQEAGPQSAGELAAAVSLRPGTLSGILDRLEAQRLITRERHQEDRRRLLLEVTPSGRELLAGAPPSLQEDFLLRFRALSRAEQEQIAGVLEQLVGMMSADKLDAAPLLVAEPDLRHCPGAETLPARRD